MADYLSVQSSPLGTLKYVESSATATVTADFLGPGTTVFSVKIDCTANTGEAVYLKVWNTAGTPTVGTTAPTLIFHCPAGGVMEYFLLDGFGATAAHVAVVREAGTAGTTAPSGTVAYTIMGS